MASLAQQILRQSHNQHRQALLDTNGNIWSFDQIRMQIEHLAGQAQALGVQYPQRVAVVLPAGPSMALTFLAISSVVAFAPLNSAYREEEYLRYLRVLQAHALIVFTGQGDKSRRAASRLDVPVWELRQRGDGMFTLADAEPIPPHKVCWSSADDAALILHTSGTTSLPKQVPLTHRNLSVSARNVGAALHLTQTDRCLNVMPLYHIHGLVAGLLAPLLADGSVICSPGFSPPDFLDWLDRLRPTWYTAVPTMHQSLLARLKHTGEKPICTSLRFIRSSSASLPPSVLAELEAYFHVPVIEAYGMTEAAHQITSNPLPPDLRKAGSVGIPSGPEVAVLSEDGLITAYFNITGEIVIRGENVMTGYVDRPEANADAFVDGWFRTGDLGHFDLDGYLFLSGRLKEMINRGGEKIAPREVDEVLLAHPAVSQAVAFAMPDTRLGEEVGAAVIPREGVSVNELDLQRFVAHRLAHFKVPRRIIFVENLPVGPTGKLQRIGLAERLGIYSYQHNGSRPNRPPQGPVETILANIWQQVLQSDAIYAYNAFLELGGDSLQAMRIAARVQDEFGVDIPLAELFAAATVAEMALVVTAHLVARSDLTALNGSENV